MATKEDIRILLDEQTKKFENVMAVTKADIINEVNISIRKVTADLKKVECSVDGIQAKIHLMQEEIYRMKNQCDVVMRNIPIVDGENLQSVFTNIASVINFQWNKLPLLYRINIKKTVNVPAKIVNRQTRSSSKSSNSGAVVPEHDADSTNISFPPIMIKFYSQLEKSEFMNLYFRYKNLSLTDIGFKTATRIIISESLTASSHKIFIEAATFKKQGKISKLRVRNGVISVQVGSNGKFHYIESIFKLKEIVGSN